MATNTGHVMTLANSIIGVSVLAMPFCFKQCGITLAILMLILSSVTTRLACHFLVKSSSMCKRRNFEFLAFYTFGPSGKLLVELGIIGFMMGTCVAFFVVIGDLGPEIISKMFQVKNDSTLRSIVLLGLGFCVVLPLGLLRNIESLAAISTVTIGFYFLLIVKIFLESFSHLLAGDWIQKVNFWQPEGVLQCIPIFAMALSCQTQIFEIYESLPSPTLDKMNSVVRSAVNICTVVYISVGVLGYIAYCTGNFTGNILLSFAPSLASEMYKLGFVMSIAVSFPLVIFPCRASLYSLIFRRMPIYHELSQTSSHIPDARFKGLTVAIVGVAMITGLLIPSIELVLGFLGSTIGVAICVIFPALSFINLTNKETNERITAKITLLIGLIIMITGSLANYQAATEMKPTESSYAGLPDVKIFPELNLPKKLLLSTESVPVLNKNFVDVKPLEIKKNTIDKSGMDRKPEIIKKPISDQKKEPPFPVAPVIDIKPSQKPVVSPAVPIPEVRNEVVEKKIEVIDVPKTNVEIAKDMQLNEENINKDAIEKEEREMKEVNLAKKKEEERKEEEFLQKLKEHQDEQKKLLQEQQKILNDIKNRESEKLAIEAAKEKKKEEKPVLPEVIKPVESDVKKVENANVNVIGGNVGDHVQENEGGNIAEEVKESKKNVPVVNVIEKAKPPVPPVLQGKQPQDGAVKPKVAASIPLPLAKLQVQSRLQVDMNKKVDPAVQSKQEVMGRDILAESNQPKSLAREKRDVDVTESKPVDEVKSDECPIEKKEDVLENTHKSENETENVSQETVKKEEGQVAEISQSSADPEKLIKDSQHISLDLQLGNELRIGENDPGLIAADSKMSVPKKRDLKSMKSNERNRESYK